MSSSATRARILPLAIITGQPVGGKAAGLARLIDMGLRVPEGFVVVGARPDLLPDGLGEAYLALGGGPVAVRSSALGEDGRETSFAGQYQTLLGVVGEDALRQAVGRCLRSLHEGRAGAYRRHAGLVDQGAMAVAVSSGGSPSK